MSALSEHIIKHHKLTNKHNPDSVFAGYATTQKDINAFFNPATTQDDPSFEEALLDWITYTNKPFTVTESDWFIRMLKAAGFKGQVPKGDAIRNKLKA